MFEAKSLKGVSYAVENELCRNGYTLSNRRSRWKPARSNFGLTLWETAQAKACTLYTCIDGNGF
jgi:hypothetical protein